MKRFQEKFERFKKWRIVLTFRQIFAVCPRDIKHADPIVYIYFRICCVQHEKNYLKRFYSFPRKFILCSNSLSQKKCIFISNVV